MDSTSSGLLSEYLRGGGREGGGTSDPLITPITSQAKGQRPQEADGRLLTSMVTFSPGRDVQE